MWGTIKPNLQGSKPSNHEIITSLQTFPCCPQNLLGECQRSTNTPREHQQFLTHLHSSRIISILTKSPKFQCFPNIWDFYIFLGFFFFWNHLLLGEAGEMKGEGAELPNSLLWVPGSAPQSSNPQILDPGAAPGSVLIPRDNSSGNLSLGAAGGGFQLQTRLRGGLNTN